MVRAAGVEPTTYGSGGRRSIQLSYARKKPVSARTDRGILRADQKERQANPTFVEDNRPSQSANGASDTSLGRRPRIGTSKFCLSANGAIHPFRIVPDGVMKGTWRCNDGPGFQPLRDLRFVTWGVAPGWYESAPLALSKGSAASFAWKT